MAQPKLNSNRRAEMVSLLSRRTREFVPAAKTLPPQATTVIQTTRDADDERWMRAALERAEAAGAVGEVPVGAVLVRDGALVAEGRNAMRERGATAHAELSALQSACAALGAALGAERLEGCTLYVTLEPCAMCAGAIVLARVDRVVFGAWDDKAGMAGSVVDLLRHPRLNHSPEVRAGVLESACAELLKRFFANRR